METGAGRVRLVGAVVVVAGLVAGLVLATDGLGRVGGAWTAGGPTVYGPLQVLLAATTLGAGLVLLMRRGAVVTGAALGVAGLCTAQLAGTGLVATRRWPLYRGCCSTEQITAEPLVTALAALLAVVCGLAAATCLVLLVRGPYATWSQPVAVRATGVAAGVVVLVVGPVLVTGLLTGGSGDRADLLAWTLACSLPIGAALALSSALPRPAAWTVLAVVVAGALAASLGTSFLETRLPWGGARALVVAAAVVVALSRTLPQPRPARLATDAPG
ncbi:hypothetical protein [Nocardioides bruguierae]|uniref:Uncharacterized protein n=1 Tax=Nocardioides bruguierae TaxID=2945102 RepID=A0A9X2D635_9ACTN|nr:hypothetical protein [Nocardioides bruguierae]MCM0619935.1 hypothetical protein [Nocardioides bruguierae]